MNGKDLAAGVPEFSTTLPKGRLNVAHLRVLVVDDETTLRRVIARNLVALGHLAHETATATDAIRAVVESHPDLILLDINLPDRTGWDVLRELRRRGIEIPTIIVSAVRVSPARLEEFKPLAYLPKPFPLESLLRVVESVDKRKDEME